MMGIDADIKGIAWADRMLMQLEPISIDESSWRASDAEDMMRDLLERARDLMEVRGEATTQLPAFPAELNLQISPIASYTLMGSLAPPVILDAPMHGVGEMSTLSSASGTAPNATLSSDIEEFGMNQPILAAEQVVVRM